MKKVRIGVLGGYRGTAMINYCKIADHAEVVAICDKNLNVLEEQKELCKGVDVTFYERFEDFIEHEMDAVVLANYANEHARFAIKALERGLHVFSEVLPVQTMKEAVELVEAVERSGKIYAYGENYCYMPAPYEMRRLYRENKIGEFEYGECEYAHNGESFWHSITYGEKDHWRNNMFSTFYCTHSIGPIIHATGLRPVRVTGFESTRNERGLAVGRKGACVGIIMLTLENGAMVKSIHGWLYENSVWYSMYGNKGRMECAREDAGADHISRIYVKADEFPGEYANRPADSYLPKREFDEIGGHFGHGGSDFYCIHNFVEKILGNPDADIIDVYEALDMSLPGLFAFRSILQNGASVEIPNLRNKEEREKWRNDTACTDPAVAGDMLLPTCKGGTPEIADTVYDAVKQKWDAECQTKDGYYQAAFHQSEVK